MGEVHAADLTDPGDLAGLEQAIAAAEPDLLVNNAGTSQPEPAYEMTCIGPY